MKKKAFHFTHPSQLTAEAIEAAQASGNEELVKAIVAARHERRVRLASKIEEKVAEEAEVSQKLAQRKAYRESLVNKVVEAESAKSKRTASSDGFVKVSNMSNSSKKAFAAKAIAQGFPQEYVEAMLGSDSKPVVDNTKEIRTVMSSDLSLNVKKSAVTSMVREATLSDADYSRLINYWKNELGYGDQEWIDALFTKKYDK
jgi:Arc/MetJ family transcription regulator